MAREIVFVVAGQEGVAPAAVAARGRVVASVRVGSVRGGGEAVRVVARPGEDVVVLAVANGPTLVLHPEDARDLLLAQSGATTRSALAANAATRSAGGTRAAGASAEVVVPAQLGWPGLEAGASRGATRGWLGQALLTGFHVLTGVAKDPAVSLATAAVTKKVDGQVEEGVYLLSADTLEPLKGSGRRLAAVPPPDGGPLLVLVHGTFSETDGTFSKLWTQHNAVVRRLFARYGDCVYGLDHATLGASPIANALTLVRAAPAAPACTCSRIRAAASSPRCWARACGGALTKEALALFSADAHSDERRDLRALVAEAVAKRLVVERVVRVACPSRGTLLASKRLDAYLSVLKWGLELAAVPVVPELVDFLHEVARRRADPRELPGSKR